MSLSGVFIRRPVATTLLTAGLALAGAVAYGLLPVSQLPQVEFPTISVSAGLPGASPETMASSVAAPLERQFGRIAGVTEMTSTSQLGSTSVVLQFDLDRDIDGAARDVQAAINAARAFLPTALPNQPTYRKVNPSEAPILILALTSESVSTPQMYDLASTVLQQRLAQVDGVGQVIVGGSSLPAVRVELDPAALSARGVGLDQVRAMLAATNANRPKGDLSDETTARSLAANDQLRKAEDYRPLVVTFRNGAAVRLQDVGEVVDSQEDLRNAGLVNGKPAVMLIVFRQPGANVIATVDRVRDLLPELSSSVPGSVELSVVLDRTPPIRASLRDVERTLAVAAVLVVLVVFVFLRSLRATLIPAVAVPVSLIGTFAVMYLAGYSLDNLSLMALTIATGFVVDDAIVVLENVSRHLEAGMSPLRAALRGAKEISFTVVSMTLSLVAVFLPILLMGGMLGRLFREFAVVLATAILLSLVLSLTTTPMMCALLLKPVEERAHGRLYRASERAFAKLQSGYQASLGWALRHSGLMLALTLLALAANVALYVVVPKGFFPQQDTGRLGGAIQADQNISFQALRQKLVRIVDLIQADPAVDSVSAFVGGGGSRSGGRMFIALKPLAERKVSADQVIARLRGKLSQVPGAPTFLQAVQDLRVGGMASAAQYQFTLEGDDLAALNAFAPQVEQRLRGLPEIVDVNSDLQTKGLQSLVEIDRATAARLGITTAAIDDALYDAFGQRQVSTIYTALNQYHVVMEVAPRFWQSPESLGDLYLASSTGGRVPLAAVARDSPSATALSVNHRGQVAAVTLSFNLAPGASLGGAVAQVEQAAAEIGIPAGIRTRFSGTAQAFRESLATEPLLILAALLAVYVVLGILYESYVHPLTILSTLPSAGMGALLALLVAGAQLDVVSLIGIVLLIGIVKKNGIMMVDFALEAERAEGKASVEAIRQACLLRFRPIMMTTLAALFGALPLALGMGEGAEIRRPLGIAIVGGLLVSQLLTLYTTPVIYLYLDRLRLWGARLRESRLKGAQGANAG
ncbi:MAG TPA: multidrug efflux RND transporter permease subunit [Myxococcales bacterium]|jgi:multidrug efflux pump